MDNKNLKEMIANNKDLRVDINDNTTMSEKERDIREELDSLDPKSLNPSEYKMIVDLVREVKDQYNELRSTIEKSLIEDNIDPDILDGILPYREGDINSIDVGEIRSFLNKYSFDHNRYDDIGEEELRKSFADCKKVSLLLYKTLNEANKIRKESDTIINDYLNYMNSSKVTESRKKRINDLKEALKEETNESIKNEINKKIHSIEGALNLSFIKERLDKFGDKEIDNIKDSYFTLKRGSYIIDRYKSKITKCGFNDNIYKFFFNIEENFLDESYHKFNNLFLFIYMRFVAYCDINNSTDKMWIQAITGALANLVYHKFSTVEEEKEFIELIKNVLDKFDKYGEYFHFHNSSAPDHPDRVEAKRIHEESRKTAIIKKLEELKITGYNPEDSADKLQEYLNEETEKMIEEQVGSKNNDVEVSEDSENVVAPTPIVKETSENPINDLMNAPIINVNDLHVIKPNGEVGEAIVNPANK